MMPLTVATLGEEMMVVKVGGREKVKRFLENLGFVPGSKVTVVSKNGGDLIVKVKDARVALNEEMAMKIMV